VKRLAFDPDWPACVRESHHYDELEMWGDPSNPGYTYAYRNRFETALRLVADAAPAPARVLDLAAAQGNFTLTLAEMGYDVVWNDLRAELASYVRGKHEFGRVQYVPGNIFELRPENLGPFDVVLATEVVEHVAHPDQFLAKVATFLRKDGTIVLTTPNGNYFRNRLPRFSDCPNPSSFEADQFKPNADGHIFLLHCDEVHSLAAQAGLRVQQLAWFTNPVSNGHVGTARLLRYLPRKFIDLLESTTQRFPAFLSRPLSVHLAASLRKLRPPGAD
jgi:2-polyprenyl-3-methyl-5-hydroxy-6-metoxy-1,4-benzoquinol methylase